MDSLTNRERIRRCAQCRSIDRAPFSFYFGPWRETLERWKSEGIENPNAWQEDFPFDKPVVKVANYVNHLHCPPFVPEILKRNGSSLVMRDAMGEIVECIEGKSGIPRILHSPVNNREEWEQLKEKRLNPNDPGRFPENWPELVKQWNEQDAPVQIGMYPCGLYGTLRDLMGTEGSLLAFYDMPELVKDIMDGLTDFWISLYEKICQDVKVDILHIWEDMSGKQGSLISPDMIREFMLPNYQKLSDFAKAHNIAVVQVDTDGDCEELIPLFAQSGVNMMLPFEVNSGCDVVELRRKYPYMSMMGGINKLEIAKGREAIDRELKRIEPLLFETGYFPALDHLIPPEISYRDYAYFVRRLHDIIFQ